MKKLLPFAFALFALASCSKSNTDPTPSTPTLTGGTWVWASETLVTTAHKNLAVTTQPKTVVPNTVKVVFGTDGKATTTIDKSISPTGVATSYTEPYSYSGTTLTFTGSAKPYVTQVTVLTSNSLTYVNTDDDGTNTYVTTDTFTR